MKIFEFIKKLNKGIALLLAALALLIIVACRPNAEQKTIYCSETNETYLKGTFYCEVPKLEKKTVTLPVISKQKISENEISDIAIVSSGSSSDVNINSFDLKVASNLSSNDYRYNLNIKVSAYDFKTLQISQISFKINEYSYSFKTDISVIYDATKPDYALWYQFHGRQVEKDVYELCYDPSRTVSINDITTETEGFVVTEIKATSSPIRDFAENIELPFYPSGLYYFYIKSVSSTDAVFCEMGYQMGLISNGDYYILHMYDKNISFSQATYLMLNQSTSFFD